nr:P1 protein [Onion yellow dwarf virus]
MMNARGINGKASKLTLAQRKRACYCSEDDAVHYHCTKCNFAFESLRMVRPVNHDCDGPMSDDDYDSPRPTITNKTFRDFFSDDVFRHLANDNAEPHSEITNDVAIAEAPKPHSNVVEVTEMKLGELKGTRGGEEQVENTQNLVQPKSVNSSKSEHDGAHEAQQYVKFGSFEPIKMETVQKNVHNPRQFIKFGSFDPIEVKHNDLEFNNTTTNADAKTSAIDIVIPRKNVKSATLTNPTRLRKVTIPPTQNSLPVVRKAVSPNKQRKIWVKKETQKPPALVTSVVEPVQMIPVAEPIYKKPLYKRKNMHRVKLQPENVTITAESLCDELLDIVHERKIALTIVGKNKHEFRSVELNGKMYYKVVTLHESGIINRLDMNNSAETISLLRFFQARNPDDLIDEFDIRKGHSGLIINPDNIIGRRPLTYKDDVMVVRGRLYGRVVDSLLKIHKSKVRDIEHY